VRDNTILDGLGKGVDVYEGGSGLFHRNEISGNEMDGVVVRTRANPTFTASKVRRVYVLLALTTVGTMPVMQIMTRTMMMMFIGLSRWK
jgi:hypothetical protein